jgi:beta-galactosidase
VDATSLDIGFRRVQIKGRDLLVNGARVMFQGVNRHDSDPRTGRVISRERMLAELSLLKRANVNAIRTSHYPNDPMLLDLCDQLGFYVVDEADVEGHAFASTIADEPLYLPEIVTRVSRMVLRDRNHPSIVAWSLGNESGYGAAHDAAAAWVRHADPSRPVQYEGAVADDWFGGHAASDIVTPMYASLASLRSYAGNERADRPLILCEYAYSQGNSTGGLADYWDLFESQPCLQGGFIWEFTDHALDRDGDGHFRYGGDFGDVPNSGAVLLNGIVFADLTPKPALAEAQAVFSPVRMLSHAHEILRGTLRLRNRLHFTDLSELVLEAAVVSGSGLGTAVALEVTGAPDSEVRITIPAPVVIALQDSGALALQISVRTKVDRVWAPAGTVLAHQQVVVPHRTAPLPDGLRPPPVDDEGRLTHQLLEAAPTLCLWRALTDNDQSVALDQRFVRSGFFRLDANTTVVEVSEESAIVDIWYRSAFGDPVHHRRSISEATDGTLIFDEQVVLPDGTSDGLRVGMELHLVPGFERAMWLGLGPHENYPDRRRCAMLGRWEARIDDLAVPYVLPQENGTRGGVTELVLSGRAGTAHFASEKPLHINVGRYTTHALEQTEHWWELQPRDRTIVHLDIAHRGLGTGRIGPDTHPQYRLVGTLYRWRWAMRLEPYNGTRVNTIG